MSWVKSARETCHGTHGGKNVIRKKMHGKISGALSTVTGHHNDLITSETLGMFWTCWPLYSSYCPFSVNRPSYIWGSPDDKFLPRLLLQLFAMHFSYRFLKISVLFIHISLQSPILGLRRNLFAFEQSNLWFALKTDGYII